MYGKDVKTLMSTRVSDEIPGDETNTAESPKNTASETDFTTPPNQQ